MIGVLLAVMEPDVTTASCPYKAPQKKTVAANGISVDAAVAAGLSD